MFVGIFLIFLFHTLNPLPMKKIILLVLLFNCFTIFSQEFKFEAPDYKKIENTIKDKKSTLYYPKLQLKFKAADSTMTLEEKRHYYYGYTFQKEYAPYSKSKHSEKLEDFQKKENLTQKEYEKATELCNLILSENPFDIRTRNYKSYCLDKSERKKELENNILKTNIIFETILSSGDGVTKETAFYVINTSNEYALLNALGFEYGGNQSLIEHYDFLTLKENQYKIKGFYFDISPCLNSFKF